MGETTSVTIPPRVNVVEKALATTEELLKLLLEPNTDKVRARQVMVLAEAIFGAALAGELRRVNPALAEIEQAVWGIVERAMTAFFAPRLSTLLSRLGL